MSAASQAAPIAVVHDAAGRDHVDVDVVIVSYRCRDSLLAALDALADLPDFPASVTVVDNDSRDGTVEALQRRHPAVTTRSLARNTGFAHAANLGMAVGSGRYVMLLNPDAIVVGGALAALVEFADAHPRAGVVAPAVVNPDGSDQLTARAFPTAAAGVFGRRSILSRAFPHNRWTTRFLSGRAHADDEPFRTDWVSGAAMLVPRTALCEVGGLDDSYFLFWEDADWCRRMAACGREVWCVPQARVVHEEGGSRNHGWSPETIRWFHQGAYRYWTTYHAHAPWSPWRWAAAFLLTARAAMLTVRVLVRAAPVTPCLRPTVQAEPSPES